MTHNNRKRQCYWMALFLILFPLALAGRVRAAEAGHGETWETQVHDTKYRITMFTRDNSKLPDVYHAVQSIVVGPNRGIWANASNRAAVFDGHRWKDKTGDLTAAVKSPDAVAILQTGRIVYGIWETLDRMNAAQTGERYWKPGPDLLPAVTAMGRDPEHNVWFSCFGELYKFDGKGWHEVVVPAKIATSPVTAIHPGAKGELVVGTRWGGVAVLRAGKWKVVREEVPLKRRGAKGAYCTHELTQNKIATDGQGTIWIAPTLASPKLQRYDGKALKEYPVPDNLKDGLGFSVLHFDRRGKRLILGKWAGWNKAAGLIAHDGKEWRTYTCKIKPEKVEELPHPPPPDTVAAAVMAALLDEIEKAVKQKEKEYEPMVKVSCIYADREGRIWLGAKSEGLAIVDGDAYKLFPLRGGKDRNPSFINCIVEDADGNIWIGCDYGGVYRICPVRTPEKTKKAVTPPKAE